MPANGKVSLTTQTLFCIIPFLDIYAAYRIKKLRKYLVIVLSVGIVSSTVISSVPFLMEDNNDNVGELASLMSNYGADDDKFLFYAALQIGIILLAIFLIRRWSKQWNEQFDSFSTDSTV